MFSVVIPVYNRSSVLERALESVLTQTCQSFEILVMDDGSQEDITVVTGKFDDPRIKVVRLLHMGACVARNVGIAMAKYEWIAFLDSDDWWHAGKLAEFKKYIEANPDRDFVYSAFSYWDETSNVATPIMDQPVANMTSILLVDNIIHGTSIVVIRRKRLMEVDGFDVTFPARQDLDLYVRLSKIVRFGFIPVSLCYISYKTEKRISTNPVNRLVGYVMFYKKHRGIMTFGQRVYTSKRILFFAYRCRDWKRVFAYVLPAIPSILFKFKY
ncbi:MAG TPA: glycosyltransferase [Chryseosolibacter sp.]|nr:glycosyltransferase [Chryseosolibacter sp.]